jgi:hypothetical protein
MQVSGLYSSNDVVLCKKVSFDGRKVSPEATTTEIAGGMKMAKMARARTATSKAFRLQQRHPEGPPTIRDVVSITINM